MCNLKGNDDVYALNVLFSRPQLSLMLCLFVPSEIEIVFTQYTQTITHFSLHFLHFLLSNILYEEKLSLFPNTNLRTLKVSSSSSMATSSSAIQESVQGTSSNQEAPVYEIKGRTMSLDEWDLTVQVERLVDFASRIKHGCDIVDFYEAQDLGGYFSMLNGPTYESLVKHFWVRASVYDKHAAKLEEDQKVLIDPSLEGKTREEMGLEPSVATEIRSSIMGVPIFINQETIAYVIGRASEGNFKDGLDNKKSP